MKREPLAIKHVFWDWNGTLLDDARLCASIINDILEDHGLDSISFEQYRQTFNFPVSSYYKRLGLSSIGVSFEQTSSEFIQNYQLRWKGCSLQKHAISTLRQIKDLGIPQSIITAGKESFLDDYIKHYELGNYFCGLVGVDHIHASGKIARAIEYAKGLNLGSGEVLVVGDTTHDHEVGLAMSAHVLLFSKGHHPIERLEKLGSPVISCLSTVLEHL